MAGLEVTTLTFAETAAIGDRWLINMSGGGAEVFHVTGVPAAVSMTVVAVIETPAEDVSLDIVEIHVRPTDGATAKAIVSITWPDMKALMPVRRFPLVATLPVVLVSYGTVEADIIHDGKVIATTMVAVADPEAQGDPGREDLT